MTSSGASRPPRRPVVGSRNPTGRPRKVAGSRADEDQLVTGPEPETAEPPVEPPVSRPAGGGLLGSLRTTLVLAVALVSLVAVALEESWYLWLRDEPVVSASRPVVTGEMAHRAAVEAATQDTEEILSTSYKNYDEQVTQATSRMTGAFAEQYRTTIGDIKTDFVAAKTELQVKVVAAGVVRASSQQVQALLFLNQYVSKAGKDTTFTPYRALVTMVHTDHGWLVSQIDTK